MGSGFWNADYHNEHSFHIPHGDFIHHCHWGYHATLPRGIISAFLGYNPVETILSSVTSSVVSQIPPATLATLTGISWFPSTLAEAFMPSLRVSFYIGAFLSGLTAILSALRGERYIHELEIIKINPDDEGADSEEV